jgi:uncharacterized protein (DUF433 family)
MIARDKELELIESRPGVCGGDACIAGTRIPVWMLYEARLVGISDKQLLDMHRSLSRAQLSAAWEYAKIHEEELLASIRENNED